MPSILASRDNQDLERAVKAARASKGKTGRSLYSRSCAPHRTLARPRSPGLHRSARARPKPSGVTGLLRHQGVECRARLGPFDPAWLDGASALGAARFVHVGRRERSLRLQVVVAGTLSRGAMFPADGLVLVTEEEIFGGRAHRRKERKQKDVTRPFLGGPAHARRRRLHRVHVEHGIGRYHGLAHKQVAGM